MASHIVEEIDEQVLFVIIIFYYGETKTETELIIVGIFGTLCFFY